MAMKHSASFACLEQCTGVGRPQGERKKNLSRGKSTRRGEMVLGKEEDERGTNREDGGARIPTERRHQASVKK